MTIKTLFIHQDGRRRILDVTERVRPILESFNISMTYETGEISKLEGITRSEAERWYREQGQALVCQGFLAENAELPSGGADMPRERNESGSSVASESP